MTPEIFFLDLGHFFSFLVISVHLSDDVDVPSLPMKTDVSDSPGAVTLSTGNSAADILWSKAVDWSLTVHKSKYADCFGVL